MEPAGTGGLRRWSWFYARFLSWQHGRRVVSPYLGDGCDGSMAEQLPMRFADTGEPVTRMAP